jgi:hypothetical protein
MAPTVAEQRAAAAEKAPGTTTAGAARLQPFGAQLRVAELVDWKGEQRHQLDGIASTVNQPYEMWDFFGTYTEVIDGHAFDETLDADPDVAFLMNHKGVTMARTRGMRSLTLGINSLGLTVQAFVNPERQDVSDMVVAIRDRDITEMSFAFMIEDGGWNDDYTQFTITKISLDRGDVSAVNYGANPYTSIAARSAEILGVLDRMPAGAARAAMTRLRARADLNDTATARATPPALELVDMDALRAEVARRGGLEPSLLEPSKLVAPVPGLKPEERAGNGRSVSLARAEWIVHSDDD